MDFTVAVIAAEHTAAPEPSGLVHHKQAEHTAAVVASIHMSCHTAAAFLEGTTIAASFLRIYN